MIYLNKKQFLPSMILISVMFLPFISMLACLSLLYHVWKPLLTMGVLSVIYLSLVFCFFKISKSTKKYLVVKNEGFEICCGNKFCDQTTGIWTIPYHEIKEMHYFKISSLQGWLSLWTGLLPRCVFITIRTLNGNQDDVFIGYLDLNQVKKLASIASTELIIH